MHSIWKRPYTLRRYKKQKNRRGYFGRGYTETTVMLNVQTVNANAVVTKEGKRPTKSIKAFGSFPIKAADVKTATQGDRLFFEGEWYECTSCVHKEHTPLTHYLSQFTLVSEAIPEEDLTPPNKEATEGDAQ